MQKLKSEKFRLGCYVGDPNTSLSLSRGLGPLLDMAKQDRRLELVPAPNNGNDLNWSWLHSCDALFMEQPYTDQHVNCVYTARFLNLPVWLDWGDDLFNINKTNPALFQDHRLRDKAQLRENLGELFKCASVVSTATETLRQSYAAALGGASVPASRGSSVASPHQCAPNPEYEASIAGSVKVKAGTLRKFFFEQRGRVLAALGGREPEPGGRSGSTWGNLPEKEL